MHSLVFVAFLATLARTQDYSYVLDSAFHGGPTFLDNFDFWTSWDPTFGYVHYVDQSVAEEYNMINITDSTTSWGVDTTSVLDPNANLGRLSVRLTSHQSWTHGLFILDLAHMPDATCGVWPSFWTLGGTGVWPSSGEIDVIEFTNQIQNDLMALHTSPGCSVAGADQTGTLLTSDCGSGGGFTGCAVSATRPDNSAASFNSIGGGVYVLQWTSVAIRIWFFPRDGIPESITSGTPDIATFGLPAANFQGECDLDAHFSNHSLIFNTDFCGQWAGPTFEAEGCPQLAVDNSWQSCNDFVALNPAAFYESYWEVNYLNVYTTITGTVPKTTSSLSSVTPAIETSSIGSVLSNAQGRSSTPTLSLSGPNSAFTITTGSFTATSSLRSDLSPVSAKSESADNATGQAGSGLTPPPALTAPPTGTQLASETSAFSPASSKPTLPISVNTPVESLGQTTPMITANEPITSACTEAVCTATSYVVVIQTVFVDVVIVTTTVGILAARQLMEPRTTLSATALSSTRAASSLSSSIVEREYFPECNFTIPGDAGTTNAITSFACTFAKAQVFSGRVATATYTTSTVLHYGEGLILDSLAGHLEIDAFVLQTEDAAGFMSNSDVTFTGNFTASSTSVLSTTITARPVMQTEVAITTTLSNGDLSPAPTLTIKIPRNIASMTPQPAPRDVTQTLGWPTPFTTTIQSTNFTASYQALLSSSDPTSVFLTSTSRPSINTYASSSSSRGSSTRSSATDKAGPSSSAHRHASLTASRVVTSAVLTLVLGFLRC